MEKNYLTQVIIMMVKICINGIQSGTKHLLQRINYSCTLWKIIFWRGKTFFFSPFQSVIEGGRRSINFSTFHKTLFSHSYLQDVTWTSWLLSIIHPFLRAFELRLAISVKCVRRCVHSTQVSLWFFFFYFFLSRALFASNSVRLLNTCFE